MNRVARTTIFFVLLIFSQAAPLMKIGDVREAQALEISNFTNLHQLQVTDKSQKYLFVNLVLLDSVQGYVDILNGSNALLRHCPVTNSDECYLKTSALQINDQLQLKVRCIFECKYTLETYLSGLEHLQIDQSIRFVFNTKEKRQLYHLELNDTSFNQLRIIVKPETRRQPFDVVKFYGSYGVNSQPSIEQHDFASVRLWEDAEGIFIKSADMPKKSLNLIIHGSSKTVYILTCTVLNGTSNELVSGVNTNGYLGAREAEVFHASFGHTAAQGQYVIKLSVFSGELKADYYIDSALTQPFDLKYPFEYMGDTEILLDKSEAEGYPHGLYVRVSCGERPATFMLFYQIRKQNQPVELFEHVSQFIDVMGKRILYFDLYRFKNEQKEAQLTTALFTLTTLEGVLNIIFLKCSEVEPEGCLSSINQLAPINPQPSYRFAGLKRIFEVGLNENSWRSLNNMEDTARIVVQLTSSNKSIASAEYLSLSRIMFLRENRPMESFLRKGDLRTFKYQGGKGLKEVHILLSELSGKVEIYSFREIPHDDTQLVENDHLVYGPLLIFYEKLGDLPIVIILKGMEEAVISILLRTVSYDYSEKLNAVTLMEDQPLRYLLAIENIEIFEMFPFSTRSFFEYSASSAIKVCILNEKAQCEANRSSSASSGQVLIQISDLKNPTRVRVQNPSKMKNVQLTVTFHSHDLVHCQSLRFGEVQSLNLKGDFCLSFILPEERSLQVYLMREDLKTLNYSFFLCGDKISTSFSNGELVMRLYPIEIREHCKAENSRQIKIVGDTTLSEDIYKMQFLGQYLDGRIILTDGVAFKDRTLAKEGVIREFVYDLLTKITTSIIVVGTAKFHFTLNVIESHDRQSTFFLGDALHSGRSFFGGALIKLTPEQIAGYKCGQCSIVIQLFTSNAVDEPIEYSLEITQNYVHLTDGTPKQEFLSEGSLAYFSYEAVGNSLYVEVSDNNNHCAVIYMSRMEYPNKFNFMEKSFDGEIFIQQARGQFYFSVEALRPCAFTISIMGNTLRNVIKLEKGTMGLITVTKGEKKYFTFRNSQAKPFKILALSSFGILAMRLNVTTRQLIGQFLMAPNISGMVFSYKSPYDNRLIAPQGSEILCEGCEYLLEVEALSSSQSTVLLVDQQTQIPLIAGKTFYDAISVANETTTIHFIHFNQVSIDITVYKGEVEVNLDLSSGVVVEKFSESVAVQKMTAAIPMGELFRPIILKVKAVKNNSIYSLQIPNQLYKPSNQRNEVQITPGLPGYLFLEQFRQNCFAGRFRKTDEKLIISMSSNMKPKLDQLTFVALLNDKSAIIKTEIVRNTMAITFQQNSPNLKEAYKLCISHPTQQIFVTLFQSEGVSLLPQNVETMVIEKQKFTLYPESDFLLDVFECRGLAKIRYGDSPENLQKSEIKPLEIIGMPGQSHAMRITRYSLTFLDVIAPLAVVRWFPLNFQQGRGLGYMLFTTGKLQYNSAFGRIELVVQPLQVSQNINQNLNKNFSIQSLVYTMYIAPDEDSLKQAALCERFSPESVFAIKISAIMTELTSAPLSYVFMKDNLIERYNKSENLFVSVTADLLLATSDPNVTESYRFLYSTQEIPSEVFTPSNLQKLDIILLILLGLTMIAVVVVFTYALTNFIIPMLARLKLSLMVEEEEEEEPDLNGHQPMPQSSDRNAADTQGNKLETEDVMQEKA